MITTYGSLHRLALLLVGLAALLLYSLAGVAAPSAVRADELAVGETAPESVDAPASQAELAASLGMSELELQTLNLINLDRLSRGIQPLTWDPKLAEVARAHAAEMMATGKVTHEGVDGSMPYARIKAGADRVNWAGENIWTYRGRLAHLGPDTMHAAMMAEPHEPNLWNHIWNVLYPGYHRVGIAIVVSPTGVQYLTEDFAD
ncbi:MAG TPA: CAP domain-containing protein [Chloroflexota bacterium]|nr:CAP domain-containing protein [Chloroflexota bacterium]